MEKWEWWYCKTCNRLYRDTKRNLIKHMYCGPTQRPAGNHPWWHGLYCPALYWAWAKLKWEGIWKQSR